MLCGALFPTRGSIDVLGYSPAYDRAIYAIDVIAKNKIRWVVSEMNRKGTTFILTTHDLEDLEQLADNVIITNHGKKVFDDSLSSLKSTLGSKKIINLTLYKPYTDRTINSAEIIGRSNELDISLEVNTSQQSITDFLESLTKYIDFKDISVKELPMDLIITRIYNNSDVCRHLIIIIKAGLLYNSTVPLLE